MSEDRGVSLEVQLRDWGADVAARAHPYRLDPLHELERKEPVLPAHRRRIVALAVAAAVGLIAMGLVAWWAARDERSTTVVVDDGANVVVTTVAPPRSTVDPIDDAGELEAYVRRLVDDAGLTGRAAIAMNDGLLEVSVQGVGTFNPVAPVELQLFGLASTFDIPDPVASYRNCVEATGDPDAAPCADMKAASDPDVSGHVWLGERQVRAVPLYRLDALDQTPSAYLAGANVISAEQAGDPAVLAQILACQAAHDDYSASLNRASPARTPPPVCVIPGALR